MIGFVKVEVLWFFNTGEPQECVNTGTDDELYFSRAPTLAQDCSSPSPTSYPGHGDRDNEEEGTPVPNQLQ